MANVLTAAEILASAADLKEHEPICALACIGEVARWQGGQFCDEAQAAWQAFRLETGCDREADSSNAPAYRFSDSHPKEVVAATMRNAKRWLPSGEGRA